MISRYLEGPIRNLAFVHDKMAFVSGPRQCGKTTLAKMMLDVQDGRYFNWDEVEFRRLWTKSPRGIIPPPDAGRSENAPALVVLDEIHKARNWKRSLKGVYDTLDTPARILVTGSARLSVFRKGSDSLMGRYYHFRLHPFTLRELTAGAPVSPSEFREGMLRGSPPARKHHSGLLDQLMRFGGFPEPFLAADEKRLNLWRRGRVEKVIREDLRDLSRIPELSRIEMLVSLLPERVGSLFSRASLREDLEVSFDTVRRWMEFLFELYYAFEIRPYAAKVARSLRREGKLYLWDYSEVAGSAARFENLVAAHLLKACHYWTDTGEGRFDLFYLRNKEKQEIDFLVVKDGRPWLPVEVKEHDATPSPHFRKFLPGLGCPLALQLVRAGAHHEFHDIGGTRVLVVSASRALNCLA